MNQPETREDKVVAYHNLMKPQLMQALKKQIQGKLVVKKKYRDHNYTARQLAADLNTNVHYISAAIRLHFHTNFTSFVNQLRIKEAMMLMNDPRYETRSIEEIGDIVGFVHRQTFHAVFLKHTGMTPKAYRMQQSLSTQEET